MFALVLVTFCLNIGFLSAQNIGGFCKTPSGESGKCISIYQCDPLLVLVRAPSRTQEQLQFLTSSRCGFQGTTPLVCCGSGINKISTGSGDVPDDINFTPNSLIPNRQNCGIQFTDKIFNGESTQLDEFPWMGVIEYQTRSGGRKIACGGSLINPRYILTAAHCVILDVLVKVGQPINIRLGEYDTASSGRDCVDNNGIEVCNQPEINVGIEEIIPHPSYSGQNSRTHDIALVRLSENVQYSAYVQPICLPTPNESLRDGEITVVAGWGKTEKGRNSEKKLKLNVPIVNLNSCSRTYSSYNIQLRSSQICAGGEDGKDSCTGDSGGPLMRRVYTPESRWVIEGVVSFGWNYCGTSGFPGVYTKVSTYLPWIHKNIRA
ncbi:phenoloxidase-activating factor 1-like isoform X2 [Anthonomus grandis grandis]|uniref:phenoloxidase-activating factor 1-like isoform X2 n=1 Tax=Anthonomus grandis grandis TaxID=2921223 RepID=UPI002165D0D3|nr:phenoloxidase-activating factor 1-like isoform X2 [Anthonomus grandis grandis]